MVFPTKRQCDDILMECGFTDHDDSNSQYVLSRNELYQLITTAVHFGTSRPTNDTGPWCYGVTKTEPRRAYVESQAFNTAFSKYDARLYIDGNFGSIEEKAVYAQNIAAMLNAFKAPTKKED